MILMIGIICWVDQQIVSQIAEPMGMMMNVAVFIVGFIVLAVTIYIFPLIARYENTLRAALKNAVLISIARLPYTLLMMTVLVAAIIVSMWNGYIFMIAITIWCFIGVSAVAYINSCILRRVFLIFETNEDKTEEEGAE